MYRVENHRCSEYCLFKDDSRLLQVACRDLDYMSGCMANIRVVASEDPVNTWPLMRAIDVMAKSCPVTMHTSSPVLVFQLRTYSRFNAAGWERTHSAISRASE